MSTELTKAQAEIGVGSRGVQLRSFEDAWRFSTAVVQSGLAPSSFKTAQQVLIAIQYGAEVGFAPMQALQSVAVINGRPCLWGDALPALARSSGVCEYLREWIEGDGDQRTAFCETKRTDETKPCVKSFSVADAKRAKLWGKAGPWQQYPDRMLAMRARAWCVRDTYADALRGLQVREEVEDYAGGVPAEVIESLPVRRLSDLGASKSEELPEDVPEGDSFHALRQAIEAAGDDDVDAVNELHVDLAAALESGDITADQGERLRKLLGQKVPTFA